MPVAACGMARGGSEALGDPPDNPPTASRGWTAPMCTGAHQIHSNPWICPCHTWSAAPSARTQKRKKPDGQGPIRLWLLIAE